MGLPVKIRKKYISHKQRWDKNTILSEAELVKDYALKNKKEIRRIELLVKKYKTIAKQLNRESSQTPIAQAFLNKMKNQGILSETSNNLDDVLDISVKDFLERRLSNIVYKLKLAKTPKQARQFVVHKHISIDGKVINSPAYLVSVQEVEKIQFRETSELFNEEHPERAMEEIKTVEVEVEQVEEKTMENVESEVKTEEVVEEKSTEESEEVKQ